MDMETEPADDQTSNLRPPLRERFVFKHQLKIAEDSDSVVSSIDITNLENPEEVIDRAIFGFFSFMENLDFDSKQLFDRTMDILMEARIRQENPLTFGKEIKLDEDATFEAFLRRVRGADVVLLKELYQAYTAKQSLN